MTSIQPFLARVHTIGGKRASLLHRPKQRTSLPVNKLALLTGSALVAAGFFTRSLMSKSSQPDAVPEAMADTDLSKFDPATESIPTALYDPIEPFDFGHLAVGGGHEVYWEQSGNPTGHPVLFLHGGPGGGTTPSNRQFFDPSFYRIILMDQRGSGKSTPHASLADNTTWHLVSDIEILREKLGIEKWLIFGGSWGSTLSLSYAQKFPERVTGLILRGIFLLRKKEVEWFYQSGASKIFPEAWEPYRDLIPEEERDDFILAYHKRLIDDSDPTVQLAAARAWTGWEMATSYLLPNDESLKRGEDDKFAIAFARIENHYFFNNGFFESDGWLLQNVDKIRHIPGIIIQGRYDVVCPITTAWDLHKAWPESILRVVPNAGHSANEVGITRELVAATHKFKFILS